MHVLDFFMYVILLLDIRWFMKLISDGDWMEGLGEIAWFLVQVIFTIVYIIIFVWIDLNWIELFHSLSNTVSKINFVW